MTLKLVHDSNVVELDTPNYGDIPGCLRRLADEIEQGVFGDVYRLIGLLEADGLAILRLGEITSAYELMGLFEAAKLRVFADDAIADE
jgi:hypothetical protein